MRYARTITATEMRGINRSAVLDTIRREGPISRSMLAEKLEISLPTVMRIIDELIADGLVYETGSKEWSGGRKRSLVAFNASEQLAVGVDLGGTKIYAAVADLAGKVLKEIALPHHGKLGEDAFDCLVDLVEDLLAFSRQTNKRIRGIGVGAPGVTYPEKGIVEWAPSLGWSNFPLKERLNARFGLPVVVENDVNLSALGEMWFGAGQNVDNLVLIAVGTGIGAGVVVDGAVYRGTHYAAGEVGYLLPSPASLGQRRPGYGALESLASGTGIAERARQVLKGKRPPEVLAAINAEDVFDAVRRGEPWARTVIDETVDYLAQAVAAVCLCLDPEVVVLGGGVARSADLLIEPIVKRLDGVIPYRPNLVASNLGSRAAVMGAIINLLHNTSDFYVVRKIS